eukprot:359920-Chlamydomonas_euryale.AAC.9
MQLEGWTSRCDPLYHVLKEGLVQAVEGPCVCAEHRGMTSAAFKQLIVFTASRVKKCLVRAFAL